jgi:hypothetical protein
MSKNSISEWFCGSRDGTNGAEVLQGGKKRFTVWDKGFERHETVIFMGIGHGFEKKGRDRGCNGKDMIVLRRTLHT